MPSILNSDNGVSSGSAGLKSSADSSGVLALQTNGTTAVTVDASQNVGIGTSSPTQLLTLSNGATPRLSLKDTRATVDMQVLADNVAGYSGTVTNFPYIFVTNNAERMRVNAGAPILCLSGGSTTATGTGIAFPATQSASTDANTLDDYEEGTWTPIINPAVGTVTSSVVAGTYVKIGRQVTLNYDARITGGTITSISSIGGFPFTTGSAAVAASGSCREYNAVGQLWSLTAGPSATNAGLVNYANSTTVTNSYGWNGTLVYQV